MMSRRLAILVGCHQALCPVFFEQPPSEPMTRSTGGTDPENQRKRGGWGWGWEPGHRLPSCYSLVRFPVPLCTNASQGPLSPGSCSCSCEAAQHLVFVTACARTQQPIIKQELGVFEKNKAADAWPADSDRDLAPYLQSLQPARATVPSPAGNHAEGQGIRFPSQTSP